MQTDDAPEAGPSRPRSRPPSPPPPERGTLSALWGQPAPGQLSFTKDKEGKEKAPQRKRRKKDEGPPQGRLVFGADGMSVATPPPPPPLQEGKEANGEEGEKKGRKGKRKTDLATGGGAVKPTAKRSGGKRGRPPKKAAQDPPPSAAVPRTRLEMSPDSCIIDMSSDPDGSDLDPDIVVVGSTPPASQVSRRRQGAGGTGLADDPVMLEDTPHVPPPKKTLFASDKNKPTHAFFDLRPTAAMSAAVSADVSETGSGVATPATITATVTASGIATPSIANGSSGGKVHSFFSNGGKAAPGTLKNGWGNCRDGAEPTAPLPGGEWPSLLDGTSEPKQPTSSSALRLREPPSPVEGDANGSFWEDVLTSARSPSLSSPVRTIPAISAPPFILEHPAMEAVMADTRPDDGRETWCERHRPREAAAVLGNELEALYLRDWLEALSIGQAEARSVIRRVPRRKMKNPDLSWIVDDIGLFGEAEEFDDSDLPEPFEEPFLGPGERPDSYPPLGPFVGNTIVLTGASGTGKSAAVHAVATELGWDVFEVYPGIGKRTGPHLVNLVGDVGKNHMVGSREDRKSAAAAAQAMFAKARPKLKPVPVTTGSQGSASDPIDLDGDAPVAVGSTPVTVKDKDPTEAGGAKTKQSLILIDEADLLFDEASTFWPTVVSLIAESRRPVVITCNDLAAVPIDILPLQVILHFHAAPSYLAQPYLATVANKHRFDCDVPRLFQDCSQPCLPDLVEQPLPPNGNEPEERFDLRAALMQMQLDRHSSSERRRHSGVKECNLGVLSGDLEVMIRRLDVESFADAFVAPRPWARLETDEGDRYVPTGDDMDGTRLLPKPDIQDRYPTLASYDAAEGITASLIAQSGGGVARNLRQLQYDQTAYIRGLLPCLDPLVPLSARLLPHPSVFMDVMPWVRTMVMADDAFEIADRAAVAAGEARINPRTGRAMRGAQGYERWIDIGLEGRVAALESGMVWIDV